MIRVGSGLFFGMGWVHLGSNFFSKYHTNMSSGPPRVHLGSMLCISSSRNEEFDDEEFLARKTGEENEELTSLK